MSRSSPAFVFTQQVTSLTCPTCKEETHNLESRACLEADPATPLAAGLSHPLSTSFANDQQPPQVHRPGIPVAFSCLRHMPVGVQIFLGMITTIKLGLI